MMGTLPGLQALHTCMQRYCAWSHLSNHVPKQLSEATWRCKILEVLPAALSLLLHDGTSRFINDDLKPTAFEWQPLAWSQIHHAALVF